MTSLTRFTTGFVLGGSLLLASCSSLDYQGPKNRPEQASAVTGMNAEQRGADVKELNKLVSIFIDSGELYKDAAKMTNTPSHAAVLNRLSDSRMARAKEGQRRVAALGGDPATKGEALGVGHMALMKVREAVGNDTKIAMDETLRGEDYVVDQIEKRLEDPEISSMSQNWLTQILPEIKSERDEIKALDEAIKARNKAG